MNDNLDLLPYPEESTSIDLDKELDSYELVIAALKINIEERNLNKLVKLTNFYNKKNFIKVNKFSTKILLSTHFDDEINIPISELLINGRIPQLILSAQVDEENNIVSFPGLLTGKEFKKFIENKNVENLNIPLSEFKGGIDLLFNYVRLLKTNSIPQIIFEEFKESTSFLDIFNKKKSLLAIGVGTILVSVFVPKSFEPRLASNLSVLEGKNYLIANNLRGENLNQQKFCLLSPHQKDRELYTKDKYSISIDKPVLIFKEPLNEINIIKNNKEIWSKTATIDNKISGPLYWPIQPFSLKDIYILRVRPEGSSMGNYKDIKLEAVEDKIIKITKIENSLGKNEAKWIRSINKNISKNPDLSIALLFSKNSPKSEKIEKAQEKFMFESNCND